MYLNLTLLNTHYVLQVLWRLKLTSTGRKPLDKTTAMSIRKLEELIKELEIKIKKTEKRLTDGGL